MKRANSQRRSQTKIGPFNKDPIIREIRESGDSFIKLITDLATVLGLKPSNDQLEDVEKSITSFITCFLKSLENVQTSSELDEFAAKCKQRSKDLFEVCNSLALNYYPRIEEQLFLIGSKEENSFKLSNLRYIPNRFQGVMIYFQEFDETIDYVQLAGQPRFYMHLYRVLFKILKFIPEDNFENQSESISTFILIPCTISRLFEKLNPKTDGMNKVLSDTISILTIPHVGLSKEFIELFEEVKSDILSHRPPPYVKEFRAALDKTKVYMENNLQFTQQDYYCTLKGTTSNFRIDGKKLKSFPASVIEQDLLLGDPIVSKFDDLVGYKSYYRKSPIEGVKDYVIKTICITNPSKYKPRIIHIAQNAIQDRCKLLHRLMSYFLKYLPSDHKDNQQGGVEFLKKVTEPSYRNRHQNSVFCSDFSGATDTLSPEFQSLCFSLLFPKEIIDFWELLSSLPKTGINDSGEEIPYIQMTGQPQGLLGSFDSFSIAHHIMLLMMMAASGIKHLKASDTYAVLGDDSIVSSPNEDIPYKVHSWLSKEVNFIKNDSKSAKSFFIDGNYPPTILDFAKVSVFEGNFMSPIPLNLAIQYGQRFNNRIATILWLDSKGLTQRKWMYYSILDELSNDIDKLIIVLAVISSGQIPYLKNFEDKELNDLIGPQITGSSMFSYMVSELKQTLFGKFVTSEDEFSRYRKHDIEKIWTDLLPKSMDIYEKDLDPHHKYLYSALDNVELAEAINLLYDLNDIEYAQLITRLGIDEELISSVLRISDLLNSIKSSNDLDNWMNYTGFEYFSLIPKYIENLKVRSLNTKFKRQTDLLDGCFKSHRELFGLSSDLRDLMNDMPDKISDFLAGLLQFSDSRET